MTTWTFTPSRFLQAEGGSKANLIILNQPLDDFESFKRIWKHTKYRICADGGANRLHKFVTKAGWQPHDFLPDEILGDLDSITPDTESYYRAKGVEITKDSDQYSTDFGKAMKRLANVDAPLGCQEVIILGSISGRVDQGIGLLHEIYRETRKPTLPQNNPSRLWLISESSITFVLRPGKHSIADVNPSDGCFTKKVGILPIYGPATITTKGLEWDVKDWRTEMGGLVSTSNHVIGDDVEVETDHYVLFTIQRARMTPR